MKIIGYSARVSLDNKNFPLNQLVLDKKNNNIVIRTLNNNVIFDLHYSEILFLVDNSDPDSNFESESNVDDTAERILTLI